MQVELNETRLEVPSQDGTVVTTSKDQVVLKVVGS